MPFKDIIEQVDGYFKLFIFSGTIIYAAGFILVAVNLSAHNLEPYEIVRIQYILAGLWLLAPFLVVLSLLNWLVAGLSLLNKKLKRDVPNIRRFIRVFIEITATVIGFFLIYTWATTTDYTLLPSPVDILTPFVGVNLLILVGYCLGIPLTFFFAFVFLANIKIREGFYNKIHQFFMAGVYLTFAMMFILKYIGFYAKNFYPHIPSEFGGGRPSTLRIAINDDKNKLQLQELQEMLGIRGESKLSPPLKLLMTTDKSFFVIAPDDSNASIELPREIVSFVRFVPADISNDLGSKSEVPAEDEKAVDRIVEEVKEEAPVEEPAVEE